MSGETHSVTLSEPAYATETSTAQVVSNFAWQHLKSATIFRDQVVDLEIRYAGQPFGNFFNEIRAYASACIMSTAASLEALINELFIASNGLLRPMFSNFELEFWGDRGVERKPILAKYQYALSILGASPLDEHAPFFRDTWALIELRNALVHFKPTWDPERQRKIDLVEFLEGKYDLSPLLNGDCDFVTMKSMSAGCSQWAVHTALSFMTEFDERSHLDADKMVSFWKFKDVGGI